MTLDQVRVLYTEGLARLIPRHMHRGIVQYMERGMQPGTFLTFVLLGDWGEAAGSADFVNLEALYQWKKFMRECVPSDAHGSIIRVASWCKMGGLKGLPEFIKDLKVGG